MRFIRLDSCDSMGRFKGWFVRIRESKGRFGANRNGFEQIKGLDSMAIRWNRANLRIKGAIRWGDLDLVRIKRVHLDENQIR